MRIRIGAVLSLTALCLALSPLSFAAGDAYIYFVHGIPGRDVAANLDPNFPVDVLLNDDLCIERQITFGAIIGPLALPAGAYDVKVSPANLFVPCSNAPVVQSTVTLKADEDVTVLTALDVKGQPAILDLPNNLSDISAGQARIVLTNAADAPAIQVTVELVNSSQQYNYTVNPGKNVVASLSAGSYTIQVQAGSSILVPAQPLFLPSLSDSLIYAVGEASNGSVMLITKTIRNVL
jgi:hypothetical protein